MTRERELVKGQKEMTFKMVDYDDQFAVLQSQIKELQDRMLSLQQDHQIKQDHQNIKEDNDGVRSCFLSSSSSNKIDELHQITYYSLHFSNRKALIDTLRHRCLFDTARSKIMTLISIGTIFVRNTQQGE
ncbi:hypothetical protein AGABI2DRAFT_116923 [Agaricus bisporus var. bisporus H97]|uniref:hypothetical protein n=1 Tax=Agaricus bisporus var. bisporus (strain H97 / ATCC MYA-4626 / FGSC 10389) TaxID=936046 RepID=UPI00029F75CB|nr:hypothetical protein AGABI2DRAFT_116923 [Agaricus bisporus var. bisporus H97]EKV48099.1 hypothetical protein AGABI2DRAFT_116923 [Agaricus bisporus var. bisporus H97]